MLTCHTHTENVLKIAHAEGYGYYDNQFWQLLRFSISNPLHSKDIQVEKLHHPWCALIEDQARFFFYI